MLKNPLCPKCEDDKRVIAHFVAFTYRCNKCKTTFRGSQSKNPKQQMTNQQAHEKALADIAETKRLAEEKAKEKEKVENNT